MSDDVLPNDNKIMRHARWGGVFRPNMECCRVGVSFKVGRGHDYRQCSKPVKVTRLVDGPSGPELIGYCGTHDPLARKKRESARADQWRAENAERQKRYAREAHIQRSQPAYRQALQKIADGADDPRRIAREVLEEFDALLSAAIGKAAA